jgi:predicted nucleotidyltransferase
MSGDFVQRGEWAIQPKAQRAEAACRGGADLVIELPLPWCLTSAGYFAAGAVSILKNIGITDMSFGSESGDLALLVSVSARLAEEGVQEKIRSFMKQNPNISYPTARSAVLGSSCHLQPNDLLAVEYLQAIEGTGIQPLAVKRAGMLHDERGEADILSASEIRSRILSGTVSAPHADPDILNWACVSRLRMLKKEAFEDLPDCQDGLGQRLYDAVREEASLEAICMAAKTKRYTLSRVRRSVLCAVLELSAELLCREPPYARVLAFNQKGRELLSSLKEASSIPVLTQPKEVFQLDQYAQKIFELGSSAHDLYMLGYPERTNDRCGEDYRSGPVRIGL